MEQRAFAEGVGQIVDCTAGITINVNVTDSPWSFFHVISLETGTAVSNIVLKRPLQGGGTLKTALAARVLSGGATNSVALPAGGELGGLQSATLTGGKCQIIFCA